MNYPGLIQAFQGHIRHPVSTVLLAVSIHDELLSCPCSGLRGLSILICSFRAGNCMWLTVVLPLACLFEAFLWRLLKSPYIE